MNSTSLRVPGTVSGVLAEKGASVIFFGVHSILAILEPSGKGLPLPGEPSLYALIMTGFATITLITFWASVRLGPTTCQSSYPRNSENARPPGTFTVYLSWAVKARETETARNANAIRLVRIFFVFMSIILSTRV